MKKVFSVIMVLAIVLALGTTAVYAEPAIVGSINGAAGANGNWDGDVPKEASGDSLVISDSGDCYGFVFENLPAGVYKMAHYITAETVDSGKQMRIAPKVRINGNELRCWIDWPGSQTVEVLYDEIDDEYGKFFFVSVINIPEDGATLDAGCWQDAGAISGTLDKVVLATADYDFKDTEYVLIGEKNYGSSSFGEDPEKLLLAEEDSWVESTSYSDAIKELNPPTEKPDETEKPVETPTEKPTEKPTETATEKPAQTVAPTATSTQSSTSNTNDSSFPVWAIVVIVIVVLAAAGAAYYFLVVKKKK